MKVLIGALIGLILFTGSCTQLDTAWEAATNEGTVYNCGGEVEYCYYDDAEEELSDLSGLSCHEVEYDERTWPWITNHLGIGCRYSCTATTPGCNAHGGCFCP
jgi:hypothetical protein